MKTHLLLLLTAVLVAGPVFPAQAEAPGTWKSSTRLSQNLLVYAATPTLLGIPTPVSVEFRCDPTWDKNSAGTLGFDISLKNPARLKGFPFNDFEGPDAQASAVVQAVVTRKAKPPLTLKMNGGGWYSEEKTFVFGVSEVSKKSQSTPKTLLRALADEGAESLLITISDPRNPKLRFEFSLPVADQQAAFANLLTGLK